MAGHPAVRFALAAVAIGGAAAGCQPTVETRIANAGTAGAAGDFRLAELREDAAPQDGAAARAIADRLARAGWREAGTAPLLVEAALSARPADLGLKAGAMPLAEAGKARARKTCSDTEYRLTVSISDVRNGSLRYRGSAAETHCRLSLAAVLPHLADAAVSDLSAPGVSRSVRRPR